MTMAEFIRRARRAGWSVTTAGSGHLRYEHPDATTAVIGSRTPSDRHALKNLAADLRRALPPAPSRAAPGRADATPKPKPKRRSPASKPKPSPKTTVLDVEQAIELYRPSELPSRRPLPGAPRGYVTTDWRI